MSNTKASIAQAIFHSGAIRFGEFTLASGLKSPYYIDLSRLLTSPKNLETFAQQAGKEINARATSVKADAIASIELRGALLLAAVSTHSGRPCYVVRKAAKTYGVTGRIVGGEVTRGQKLILFDDVVTDGQSKLEAVRVLEENGGVVVLILVVVDREEGGAENLRGKGYPLESLITVHQMVAELKGSGLITPMTASVVVDYLEEKSRNLHPPAD